MAKRKNKKREVEKRKQKAGRKKTAKRKQKQKQISPGRALRTEKDFKRPSLSDLEPPEGFRTVSSAQAVGEYAKPLMEISESAQDPKIAFEAALMLWNCSLAKLRGDQPSRTEESEKKILQMLETDFKMDKKSAGEFLSMMISRYERLFPEKIQPKEPPFMFIRKEKSCEIKPVEEDKIRLGEDPVPADESENKMFEDLYKLDEMKELGEDWEEIEKVLTPVRDSLEREFGKWLTMKGVEKQFAGDLAGCVHIWMDFVYTRGYHQLAFLNSVPAQSLNEFFLDFLLRKTIVDPPLYVNWPPALKVFYRYLHERDFIDDPEEMNSRIRKIEPEFYDLLRKQFE